MDRASARGEPPPVVQAPREECSEPLNEAEEPAASTTAAPPAARTASSSASEESDSTPRSGPHEFGGAPSDAGAAHDPAGGEPASDQSVPRIVATSPPPGSVGVLEGAPLRIEFSEPMDRIATAAALSGSWLSESLPRTWNESSTVLTVSPELHYAEQPLEYEYRLAAEALSAQGLPLTEPWESQFRLAKVLPVEVPVRSGQNRNWTPGLNGAYSFLLAGDDAQGSVYRAFFSYSLVVPRGEVLGVERATMHANLRDVGAGSPFDTLGDLLIVHSRYPFTNVPTMAMYDAASFESFVLVGREEPAPAVGAMLSADLTGAFQRSFAAGWEDVQLILGFYEPSTNGNGRGDSCHIGNSGSPESENYNHVELTWLCADDCLL